MSRSSKAVCTVLEKTLKDKNNSFKFELINDDYLISFLDHRITAELLVHSLVSSV